jgi:hypothetical protein
MQHSLSCAAGQAMMYVETIGFALDQPQGPVALYASGA